MTKEELDWFKNHYRNMKLNFPDVWALIEALEQAWAAHNAFIAQSVKNDLYLTEEIEGLRKERDVANQIGDTFWEALKPLNLQALNVSNPGSHVTDLIKERDSAIMVGLRLKKLLEDAERECYELKCKEAFLEAVNHNLGKDKADLSAIKSNYLGLKAELQAWREGGLTEELLRKGDGTIKVGRGCVLISERDLEEKDAEIAALKAKVEELQDAASKRGAMFVAPCFVCGYAGEEYSNPLKHLCAARHYGLIETRKP